MAYNPNNANGQATMANSAPVVIASNQSALPITDNSGSITVDGSVTVSGTVTANAGTGTQNVSVQNASIPVTDNGGSLTVDGSVSVSNFPATQAVSGTVTVSQATAANLNANVTVQNSSIPVTDNGGSLTVDNGGTFAVQAAQSGTWSTRTQDGSGNSVTSRTAGSARPFDVAIVDGSGNQVTTFGGGTQYSDGATVATPTGTAALGFDGTNVQVLSTNATGHLNIADGGNSITIDGSVSQSGTWSTRTQDGSGNNVTSHSAGSSRGIDVSIIDGSGNQITSFGGGTQYTDGAATATPTGTVVMGTDGSNVYAIATDNGGNVGVNIQNTVNVSDGGSSVTVDGTVTASQASSTAYKVIISDGTSDVPIDAAHADGETNTENHIDIGAKGLYFNGTTWDRMRGTIADGLLVNLGSNNDITGTVTANAGTGTFTIGDGGSSITVDGTVSVTDGLNIEGDVAHDSVDSGNPVKIGFQAENSFPTAVATGDRTNGISDLFGRQLVAHVDAGMQVWKGANYSTQQTGADIWTPSAGKKICITYLAVSSYATTTGRVILWLGASGDTTYTAGTDQLVWAGSFAPSANAKPGAIISLPYGITAATADHRLKITTDAAISLDITVYGYEC
jgi:hypothetical protein